MRLEDIVIGLDLSGVEPEQVVRVLSGVHQRDDALQLIHRRSVSENAKVLNLKLAEWED